MRGSCGVTQMSTMTRWADFVATQQSAIVEILQNFQELRSDPNPDPDYFVREIERLHEVENALRLLVRGGNPPPPLIDGKDTDAPHDVLATVRAVDALRFRMTAAAAVFCSLVENPNHTSDSKSLEIIAELLDTPPIVEKMRGEVSASRFKRSLLILLPEMSEPSQESSVAQGLLDTFESTPSGFNWIIDFSAVRSISSFLLGVLYGYRETLSHHGARLSLCWLPEDLLPSAHQKGLIEKLRLAKIGGYWFSQGD